MQSLTLISLCSGLRPSRRLIRATNTTGHHDFVRFTRFSTAIDIYEVALNADLFLAFLKRLIKAADRKVFLIVDNLRVHKAKKVMAWADKHKDRIELFFLPTYAPEHNPDEFLNNDVKQSMARRPAAKSKDGLKSSLRSYMRGLQRRPYKVQSFFNTPSTRYAA